MNSRGCFSFQYNDMPQHRPYPIAFLNLHLFKALVCLMGATMASEVSATLVVLFVIGVRRTIASIRASILYTREEILKDVVACCFTPLPHEMKVMQAAKTIIATMNFMFLRLHSTIANRSRDYDETTKTLITIILISRN